MSLAEILFGLNMKETGIKRYPLSTRQRILQYAVTIFLKEYDKEFLDGLRQKLARVYPLNQPDESLIINNLLSSTESSQILHIYFPGQFNYHEFVPLTITYFLLFLYLYFSVRKIELVKSKAGIAFSAVITVLASLSMSIGLCFFFGLTFTMNGKEVFPYLVVVVGLENVLVLTKSVMSTPTHLDVKIRVAQGLSREGWSITKNLLTEVTILTVGLFTFVPAIQEFCIFAVVGLISDFFLQMLFFSTVLAIDIHRMELSSDPHHQFRIHMNHTTSQLHRTSFRQPRYPTPGSPENTLLMKRNIIRSKSHPKLNGFSGDLASPSSYPTNVVASLGASPSLDKIPKRLRLVHFWARTRIFQRAFMVCMVVWISTIVYNSGLVENLFQLTQSEKASLPPGDLSSYYRLAEKFSNSDENITEATEHSDTVVRLDPAGLADEGRLSTSPVDVKESTPKVDVIFDGSSTEGSDISSRLRHIGLDSWHNLSPYHWPSILSLYNISLAGQYISILPCMRISHVVTPDQARHLRNPEEKAQHFEWQSLAAALDPLDFSHGEVRKTPIHPASGSISSEVPFVPSSPMELFLTSVLCIISVIVLAYTMVVLYRCVCSRHYAEWRASWAVDGEMVQDGGTHVVLDAVPLVLDGHAQEVECLATDGIMLVSSCLAGQLRVWDSLSGEALATIDRKLYFTSTQKNMTATIEGDQEDLPLSDYESGSPPSRGEHMGESPTLNPRKSSGHLWNMPDLRPAINTNFYGLRCISKNQESANDANKSLFDFGTKYSSMYEDYKKSLLNDEDSAIEEIDDRASARLPSSTWQSGSDGVCKNTFPLSYCRSSQDTLSRSLSSDFNTGSLSKQGFPQNTRRSLELGSVLQNDSSGELLSNFSEYANSSCSVCHNSEKNSCLRRCSVALEENLCERTLVHEHNVNEKNCERPDNRSRPWAIKGEPLHRTHSRGHLDSPSPAEPSSLQGCANPTIVPPIWCVDCEENLIVVGCANGRLEFWEGSTGTFKCMFEDGSGMGVTAVKMIGNRVVAAKLSGLVDFLEMESYSSGRQNDWGSTSYRRTHVRTGSADSVLGCDGGLSHGFNENIRCIRLNTTKAHQQPITVLDSEGGRVLTGSQDHTLKVFRLEDQLPLYTLHGHCGPITCLFIDRISPTMSGSGSQDGLLCVWDLISGTCMYSIQAHDGSITALTHSASYVISLGTDERLCFWERFQGHLLNTIQVGSLVVWDVRTGVPVRVVKLGHNDGCVFVKHIMLLRDSVACDYGNQLRIVHFPLITDKCE
uniref:Sterol regulatory element-binding protein cleavage-activating protein n=1 Tax=Timema monikensis TaxID=170555 RepID=A0A7R9E5S3_9NEOP|nr:unnamed protein product [Timema monikensis]